MNVAVLGGGVTGLTAAWKLTEVGHTVRLLEASARLGGSIRSEAADGWLVEGGANSFREDTPEIRALLAELGLEAERMESSPQSRNRYVAVNGALVALPSSSSPAQFMASEFLSAEAKERVAGETAFKPRTRTEDVSVAEFTREHFGDEFLKRAIQPMVGGIWAGDPERLSVRHAFPQAWEAERKTGSVLRAMAEARAGGDGTTTSRVVSFRRGMQSIIDALAKRLPTGCAVPGARVQSVGDSSKDRRRVRWEGPQGPAEEEFDWVLATLPAHALARLPIGPEGGPRPLSALEKIEHPPVASVFVGFRRDQVSHPLDGFGALVPTTERRSILGVVFSSSLFPDRAPEGHVALTALAGGTLSPALAGLPAEKLTELVCEDLRALLGTQGKPVFTRHTLWNRAIPQYNLGFDRHLAAMVACEKAFPRFLIGGSMRGGISVPDCLRSGVSLAKRVS